MIINFKDSAKNYTDLIHLLYVINESENFEEEIQEIFDVDLFIRTFIMEVATVSYKEEKKI
jgi:spore coat protein CotH